ncbi:hypothetical protein ACWGID_02435 [Kribbella sp. NPDC054772]
MVSAESGRLLDDPEQLAVDLGDVRHDGNGVYTITTGRAETFRLIKRVGPLAPGVTLEYSVDDENGVPTVDLKLSERLPENDVAPALARGLAEAAAVLRSKSADDERVFGPGGTPDVDAVQRPVDAGYRAELRQRGALAAERTRPGAAERQKIRGLALTMGVADGQPNAELLRALLTAEEREILDRAADPARRPLEDRVDQQGYFAKAVGGSGVSGVVIGTAAAAFTGNPLVGLGIAIPTIVNASVGSFAERRLDRQKMTGRKPAYAAERKQREYEHPGLLGLIDGAETFRPPEQKMPRATAWRNYLRRHTMPTLATAAVAGALTPFGVPALSTAMVIASSALAKSLAERLVDTKKLDFRLRRIDATERLRLSDPTLYANQLTTEIADLQTRLTRALTALATPDTPTHAAPQNVPTSAAPHAPPAQQPGEPASPTVGDATGAAVAGAEGGTVGDAAGAAGTAVCGTSGVVQVPGSPPFTVSLAAQLIENVSGTARRALLGGRRTSGAEPTALARHVSPELQSMLAAAGPGLLGALTGAMGDKYFLNRDEPARDASKQWSRTHQEAAQAAALAGTVEPRLRAFRELADQLEQLAGLPSDLSTKAAAHGLPTVTTPPTGPRPPARAPLSAYAVQAAAGSLGGVTGAVGLDLVFDLPGLAVVLTGAGAVGSMTATPAARYRFRRRELGVHEGLESNKAVRAVNQTELLEHRAITRYLMTQLTMQAETVATQPRTIDSPTTDHIRAAVRRAELDNVPSGEPESPADRAARSQRVQALEQIDNRASDLDYPDAPPDARDQLRIAIERYESIANSNGRRHLFPDPTTVDPADGGRVTGGLTDQARAAATQAVRRLAAEPPGKPLLAERLITLERLAHTADAVDNHALHGTVDSRAYVQTEFDQTLEKAHQLWRESDVPEGLVLPALTIAASQEQSHDADLERLRRLIDTPITAVRTPETSPHTESGSPRRVGNAPRER